MPATERVERKFAAIVSVDVVGFSRLMEMDEAGTLAALKAHRNATDPLIFGNGGRIVKTTGDGLLVEYPAALAAVRSSLATQRIMAERNSALPSDRRMLFRMGVHLGEVIVEGDDIFGTAVNIAARLQEIATPGGLSLSSAAVDAIGDAIDAPLVDLGPQELRNIAERVHVWRHDAANAVPLADDAAARRRQEPSAIAVLPFDNMSNDPEQDYFVDGLTEDLITALSLIRDVRVIARNSCFAHRGEARDVKVIAAELDARYIIEGSARKAGGRVRVTAQLIDATTGQHMWAERFDGDLSDIFELQDEITASIASRVAPTVRRSEIDRAKTGRTISLDVWDLYLRMLHHYNQATASDVGIALELCDRIKERDPSFAPAYYYSGLLYYFGATQHLIPVTREGWRKMLSDAERAVTLAGDDFSAHALLALAYAFSARHDEALEHGERALELNPYAPLALFSLGMGYWINGLHEEAIGHFEECWRRGTNDPDRCHWAALLAFANYSLRNYHASLSWSEQCLKLFPKHTPVMACRAAAFAQLGRDAEAKAVLAEFLRLAPTKSVADHVKHFGWRRREDIAHYCEGLVKAGLPA